MSPCDTPAGVFLTREECERLVALLVPSNHQRDIDLRRRIERWLNNDWEKRAARYSGEPT